MGTVGLPPFGSDLHWSINQMGPETAELVREANLRWIQENGIESIETNVIYVIAKTDGG